MNYCMMSYSKLRLFLRRKDLRALHFFMKTRYEPHIFDVQWGDTEIGTLCNSRDSAYTATNFDIL